jgi:hypothetical protein
VKPACDETDVTFVDLDQRLDRGMVGLEVSDGPNIVSRYRHTEGGCARKGGRGRRLLDPREIARPPIIRSVMRADHLSQEGEDGMRQVQIKKVAKREPRRSDPLSPLDPRDVDVLRAKRRLYERGVSTKRRDR